MSLIQINRNPSRRGLAWFGAMLLAFFGMVGVLVRRASGSPSAAIYIWGAAVLAVVTYYAVPRLQRFVYLSWMYAAYPIGWVVSHVLLGIIYFGVFTPVGLVMRALGHDPMERRFDRQAASYWIKRESVSDPRRYFRQF